MNSIPVFYATSEGHTRHVAEVIASILREQGFQSEAIHVTRALELIDWATIVSAVVGGSIHAGRHQSELAAFIAREREFLNRRPAAFFSVSLAAASAKSAEVEAARQIAVKFVDALQWRPHRIACVAGKLAYTQYGFFKRWVMRQIAMREGGPTDTSRDHELTDWQAVKAFALDVAADARRWKQLEAAS